MFIEVQKKAKVIYAVRSQDGGYPLEVGGKGPEEGCGGLCSVS